MKPTKLVQLLKPPVGRWYYSALSGFGGLVPEDVEDLSKICSFVYMGSKEFEGDTLYETLYHIACKYQEYMLFELPSDRGIVYVFCERLEWWKIYERVKLLWMNIISNECTPKEKLQIENPEIIGWVEHDNKFIFSTDKDMMDKLMEFLVLVDDPK
jgi:hypothetical protein